MYIREIIGYKLRDILIPYQQQNIMTNGCLKSIEVNDNEIKVLLRSPCDPTKNIQELRNIIKKRLQDLQDHYKIHIRCDC